MQSNRSNAATARQGYNDASRRRSRPTWDQRYRNPRGLESTAEYFRRRPDALCRIIAVPCCDGKFWNIGFVPRRGPVVELLGEQVRHVLAELCPGGALPQRLTCLVEWLVANGALPARGR